MEDLFWLTLSNAEYLSNKEKYGLVQKFKSAKAIFEAGYSEILESRIIIPYKIDRLLNERLTEEFEESLFEKGIKFCTISDSDYPEHLKNIYAPPVLLYYYGNLPEQTCVGVVGSRKTTQTGRDKAFSVSKALASKGICVVSGMARGIDSCAHHGALESGMTAAVIGSGLDVCYPSENKFLMERIAESGCVISEFPPQKNPSRYTFPARNRIISGMSEAVIVVEAAAKSGALITADFALEQGREVFAFCNAGGEQSKGTDLLIAEGAIPIYDVEQFISNYT